MPARKYKIQQAAEKIDFTDAESLSGEEFNRLRRAAISECIRSNKPADLAAAVYRWMKNVGYSRADIRAAKAATGQSAIDMTTGALAVLLENGCPDYHAEHDEYWQMLPGTHGRIYPITYYLAAAVREAVTDGRGRVENENETDNQPQQTVSIQQRMVEQIDPLVADIEGMIDDVRLGVLSVKDFNPHQMIVSYEPQIKPAHAQKIRAHFEPMRVEARSVAQFKMKDIKEGYGHMSAKERRDFLNVYQKIADACDMIIRGGKVKRKRRRKNGAKRVDTSKMNYLKQDVSLSLVSIDPADINGASELWVYNVKRRRIGRYVADQYEGPLTVSRSSIKGFDKTKSKQKTVRKPETMIKDFFALSKAKQRKFLPTLSTKESDLTGRITKDTILLKVMK